MKLVYKDGEPVWPCYSCEFNNIAGEESQCRDCNDKTFPMYKKQSTDTEVINRLKA